MVVSLRSFQRSLRLCYAFVIATFLFSCALFSTHSSKASRPQFLSKPPNRTDIFPSNNYASFKKECSNVLNEEQCASSIASRLKNSTDPWHSAHFIREDDFIDLSRVLLVVQFNEPFYSTASKIYELYSPIFAEIVFCGSEDTDTQFWPVSDETRKKFPIFSLPKSVRFVGYGKPVIHAYCENGYYCVNLALQGVDMEAYDGVMLAADDLVMNFWQWKRTEKSLSSKVWLMSDQNPGEEMLEIDGLNFCNGTSQDNEKDCPPTGVRWDWAKWFQLPHLYFIDDLEKRAKIGDLFWKGALNNLTRTTNGRRRIFRGFADTFYVSKEYLPTILPIFELMNKHRVFAESAVPTALRMATAFQPDDLQIIDSAGHDWGRGRIRGHNVIDAYFTSYEIVHPVKWSLAFKNWETPEIHARDRAINWKFTGTNVGHFNKKDTSTSCVYCFLLNMTHAYYDTFDNKM